MPPGGDVRVLTVEFGNQVATGTPLSFPAEFGTGRKDRPVRLLGAMYSVSGAAMTAGGARWAMGLSVNPEHADNANLPSSTNAFRDLSIYAFAYQWRGTSITGSDGATTINIDTIFLPLYGLLRPARQQAIFWNDTEATIRGRMELFYEPAELPITELNALNTQKGLYRRA